MSKIGKLSELRKSAKKSHPYTLDTGEETITIDPPKTKAILEMREHSEDPKKVLELVCGDSFEKVYEVLQDEDFDVFTAFLEDLMESFGMSDGESGDPLAS